MKRAILAICAVACAHASSNGREMDVRNRNSTSRSRTFEWDAAAGELIAYGGSGRMLQLWVRPGRLQVVGASDVDVPPQCHGGFLEQHARGASQNLSQGAASDSIIEVTICPGRSPAEGWTGWHADLYVYGDAAVLGSIPPKLEFATRPLADGALDVGARNFRARLALPDTPLTQPIREYPEMMAFALVTGIVPTAPDGQYELVPR